YAGGQFAMMGGQQHGLVAALDLATTGTALAFNTNVVGQQISALALSGGNLYLGGYYAFINGTARNSMGAVDAVTGALVSSFNIINSTLSPPGIQSMFVDGSTLYFAGAFTKIGGIDRNNLAAIDLTSPTLTAWQPNVFNTGMAIAKSGTNIFAGG